MKTHKNGRIVMIASITTVCIAVGIVVISVEQGNGTEAPTVSLTQISFICMSAIHHPVRINSRTEVRIATGYFKSGTSAVAVSNYELRTLTDELSGCMEEYENGYSKGFRMLTIFGSRLQRLSFQNLVEYALVESGKFSRVTT